MKKRSNLLKKFCSALLIALLLCTDITSEFLSNPFETNICSQDDNISDLDSPHMP